MKKIYFNRALVAKKKLLFFALAATLGLFFTACEPKQPEEPAITLQGIKLNQTSVTLYEKEEVKLHVRYTPKEAEATAPAVVWYSDKQRVASVDDKGLVKADRVGTAVITAQCGQFEAKCTVEVVKLDLPEPEPDPEINFSLSTELIEAPAKGGTFDITVTTDTTWKAACEKSWAHLSQTEGKGNATIQVTVDPADSESTLTQKITFSVGKGKYFVTIQRKGNKFSVSPELIEALAKGGTFTITVTSDAAWTAACEQSWAKLDKTSGDGDATVKVTVNPDDTYSASSQKIVFTAGGNSYYVTIKRAAKVKMTIDKTEINVPVTGGTYTVNVNAGNEQWEAKEKTPSGIVTITKSGNKATIKVSENDLRNGKSTLVYNHTEQIGKIFEIPIIFSSGDQRVTLTLKVEEPYLCFDKVTNSTLGTDVTAFSGWAGCYYVLYPRADTNPKNETYNVSVKSNIPWYIGCSYNSGNWGSGRYKTNFVSVSVDKGTGNGSFTVSVDASLPGIEAYGDAIIEARPSGDWAGNTLNYDHGMNCFEIELKY